MLAALTSLLNGDIPDRVVWTADITYWMTGQEAKTDGDTDWATEAGYLKLHQRLGILPYYRYETFSAATAEYAKSVTVTQETQGARTVRTFTTPVGELKEVSAYLPESCSTGCVKHLIETPRDLDVLRYLLDHRQLKPCHLADYAARQKRWAAYGGLPALGLPRSPLPAFCVEWAGIENAVYLLMDHEKTVRDILRTMEEQEAPVLDAVCRLAPPLLHFPDNLTSDNYTPFFDRFMATPYRRRLERLHAAGVACAVHLDGTVAGLLPKLTDVGFDAVEALTPQPCGDVDVADMRRLAGCDRTILWGGVPGAMFAPPHTWSDMKRHVQRTLDCWRGTPFVLGVADQVPPDGDIDFCLRIAELVQSARD